MGDKANWAPEAVPATLAEPWRAIAHTGIAVIHIFRSLEERLGPVVAAHPFALPSIKGR